MILWGGFPIVARGRPLWSKYWMYSAPLVLTSVCKCQWGPSPWLCPQVLGESDHNTPHSTWIAKLVSAVQTDKGILCSKLLKSRTDQMPRLNCNPHFSKNLLYLGRIEPKWSWDSWYFTGDLPFVQFPFFSIISHKTPFTPNTSNGFLFWQRGGCGNLSLGRTHNQLCTMFCRAHLLHRWDVKFCLPGRMSCLYVTLTFTTVCQFLKFTFPPFWPCMWQTSRICCRICLCVVLCCNVFLNATSDLQLNRKPLQLRCDYILEVSTSIYY